MELQDEISQSVPKLQVLPMEQGEEEMRFSKSEKITILVSILVLIALSIILIFEQEKAKDAKKFCLEHGFDRAQVVFRDGDCMKEYIKEIVFVKDHWEFTE